MKRIRVHAAAKALGRFAIIVLLLYLLATGFLIAQNGVGYLNSKAFWDGSTVYWLSCIGGLVSYSAYVFLKNHVDKAD